MAELADFAPYASTVAVLVAIVFGVLTIRQWQRARYLAAAAELVHTIQSTAFTEAIARIFELPFQAPPESVRNDPELVKSAYLATHVFESLGVLVYHRVLPLRLVDHLVGGYVRASWKRLAPYVVSRRGEMGAMFGEWFQWLAERLEEHPAPGKAEGAHVAHRAWRP